MKRRLNKKGFTLIEAVVTVAIVGIIITPIAMVFQGALRSSIEARQQLKANQLTQEVVEALKETQYTDLSTDLRNGNPAALAGNEAMLGLDPLPSGYTVTLQVTEDDFTRTYDLPTYSEPTISDDIRIELGDATLNNLSFLTNNIARTTVSPKTLALTYGAFQVDGIPDDIQIVDGSGTEYYQNNVTHYNVVIDCSDALQAGTVRPTTIDIENYTPNTVHVYVFEDINDRNDPIINVLNGDVIVERGLVTAGSTSHYIYKIKIDVYYQGDLVSQVTTTKINE